MLSTHLLRWLIKAWKESHWVSHPAHLHTPWLYSGWLGLASPFRPELCRVKQTVSQL